METVDKIEKKEELSKLERSLKSKSDNKLSDVLDKSFKPIFTDFNCTNIFVPKDIIINLFNTYYTDRDDFRLSELLKTIRAFLFNHYENEYYNQEVEEFIYKTDVLQQELDDLKSQHELQRKSQ